MAKIAVIYCSATGTVHRLAHAVTEGAEAAGAEVRLRHVAETAPGEAVAQNPDRLSHRAEMDDDPLASLGPARGIVFAV